MHRRQAVGLLGLSAAVYGKPSARDRFIGVWKLVSDQWKLKNGGMDRPYGETPVGRLTYDKAGRKSAQLMRPGRNSTVPAGVGLTAGHASDEEIREAVSGFIAYFGTFVVDESSSTVTHHVQACLIPSWVGANLKRQYRFDSNRLILTAVNPVGTAVLVWEREPD